ncbi:queuosine precursor transporter [Legionella sp. CNM-4043-24]|uniref:queuosine precursor transporter n=1 Tax=Legionella sp. CNM-4043-24 TaxID=3421646 RepID=UPI00403AD7C3
MQKSDTLHKPQYKALTFLSMIYITLILAADVLIYKLAHVGSLTLTVGSLVTPFWFVMTDIIAEVYGYQIARRLIWSGIACGFLFTMICVTLIQFPSPETWPYQPAYDQVLGKLVRVFIGSLAGVIIGAFANTYLITKWKILVHGKYFWLRTIGSSAIGQLAFTIITLTYDLFGVLPLHQIAQLIFISFTIKLILTALFAIPSSIFVYYLKKLENIDIYDYKTNFNPFKLELKTGSRLPSVE